MAEIKLTPSQQAVVDNRGGALLVSAAAGSGKTKVLVDRLLARICDPIMPCNLDDFLVITYTKAAAVELRFKIAQALSARIAQHPNNRHLQQQTNRLYLAEISTIHAFCSNLLRSYAHIINIPADFRVAEETESNLLQEKVLERLLEEGYRNADEDFLAMVETFGFGRDDRRLPDAIRMAHKEMRCRPDMEKWLKENLHVLDITRYKDAAETPWGNYLLREFHSFLKSQIAKLEAALDEMTDYPNIEKGFRKTFEDNIKQLRQLDACDSWDALLENKVVSFGRAVVRNSEDTAVKERIAKVRTLCWSELKIWQELFFADSQSVLEDLKYVAPGASALLQFTRSFDRAYLEEKKKHKLLDFSDLEHEAIRLLTDRYTGKPTHVAKEIAKRYVEILVDEYQDSNGVQDLIFESVSREGKNRFMVGDVKQSIYRFRLADPTIFLDKYESFPDYTLAENQQPRRILLSENFRSRPEILSACNDVFRLVMRKSVGDLTYGEAEALRPGREFPSIEGDPLVELHCLTSSEEGPSLSKTDMEAEYVAGRIQQLLEDRALITDGDHLRAVEPGDIVILMRSLSGTSRSYVQALSKRGIPVVSDRGGNLLDTSEVQILIAILQIMDNPHQDVPLITALASPVFGYAPDELAFPRTKNRKDDLFHVISQEPERFASFLAVLKELRDDMLWMDLLTLVQTVMERTQLRVVFASMHDGIQRERNLMAFCGFVSSFTKNEAKTLPQLLWYLMDLQRNGGQIPVPRTSAENAVSIMTVHSSKGLEFPVVFLCDLSRKFNMQDMQDAILVDNDLAVGCNRVDHRRFVRYPTLAKKAIIRKKTKEAVSEELRVLYVAMTRAKDRLIMTYYSKHLISELKNINSQLTMPLSDDLCASARNPGKWLLMAALCRTEAGALLKLVEGNEVSSVQEHPWRIVYRDLMTDAEWMEPTGQKEKLTNQASVDPLGLELLQYQYPHRMVCDIPSKLTATILKGRVQDQEAAEHAADTNRNRKVQFRKPKFLSRELTAAEKGTATHLFLQFCDYHACADVASLKNEVERLVKAAYLTQEQAETVQQDGILAFFNSSVGRWLLAQKELRREFKFSILVDAAMYDPSVTGEKTMLQGVVDCFVIEEDGITILDFKTDRISGDAMVRAHWYHPQLNAYADALQRIYQLPVKRKLLHFFSINQTVEI